MPLGEPPSLRSAAAGIPLWRSSGAVFLLFTLAACGPLPRPFEHRSTSPLLSDQRALAPLTVKPIDGAPGLAEALTAALEHEEIAATTEAGGNAFLTLTGKLATAGEAHLAWQITRRDGTVLGETTLPIPAGGLSPAQQASLATTAARSISHLLRANDGTDSDAQPRVAVHEVKAVGGLEGDGLTRAMIQALGRQGLVIDAENPAFLVDGAVRVSTVGGGQDLVQIDWVVRSPDGKELGTVSQGSPVPHMQVVGQPAALARDIAEAGAEGVGEVIRKKRQGL